MKDPEDRPVPPRLRTRRPPALPTMAVALVVGVLTAALAVRSTGAADPLVFVEDAGPLVRWSAPLLRVVHDLSAAVTVGALLLAAVVVSDGPTARRLTTRVALAAAASWALTGAVGVALTFADAAGLPLDAPRFLELLASNLWTLEPTRIGTLSVAGAVIVALGSAGLGRAADDTSVRRTAFVLALVALVAVSILGFASHTGTSTDHETSVNAMAVHFTGMSTWVGGLTALLLARPLAQVTLPVVVRRWSSLALWSFVAVGASGVVASTTRLGPWSDLGTPYGRLLVLKTLSFLVLGVAGWWHRRRTIPALSETPRAFWRIVAGEVVLMAATAGLGAALSRSAPPEPEDVIDPSPALALTGFPAPAPPNAWTALTVWRVDWLLLAVALSALISYAAGLLALHRSGRSWPTSRTVACLAAWGGFVLVTSGGAAVQARVGFAWHVAVQLSLLCVLPVLLHAADPVGLCRGAVAPRADGSLGLAELTDTVVRSGPAALLRNAGPAVALAALTLLVLVLGPGLDWTLRTHPGHVLAMLLLPCLGYVVVAAVTGTAADGRPRAAMVAVLALATVHLAIGAGLLVGTTVLAGDFLAGLGLATPAELLADQRRAALVVWVLALVGDLALLVTARRRVRR